MSSIILPTHITIYFDYLSTNPPTYLLSLLCSKTEKLTMGIGVKINYWEKKKSLLDAMR